MAKPPPKKPDATEVGNISDARKKGWNSECSLTDSTTLRSLIQNHAQDVEAFTLITKVRDMGKYWRKMAKR